MLDHVGKWIRIVTYKHEYASIWTANFKNMSMELESAQGLMKTEIELLLSAFAHDYAGRIHI